MRFCWFGASGRLLCVADYNVTGVDFRTVLPRPPVRGVVVDFHTHLHARRHAGVWFDCAKHFGIDCFVTMTPLEEALILQREYADRLHFIAIPRWGAWEGNWIDEWLRRIEAFYNLGSRIAKLHLAPQTMVKIGRTLDDPVIRRVVKEIADRGMIIMTHIGDPETWYAGRYAEDVNRYGTREQHYQMWERALNDFAGHPWLGAHLGGNPEDLHRLQGLLDRHADLYLDMSATKWMVREVSSRRDAMRDFVIRNVDRLVWGSDQVSYDDRSWDFYASRWWCHRKLWETANQTRSPIADPDASEGGSPMLRGLALPDEVLEKIYHDNAMRLLGRVGARVGAGGG